MVVAEKMKTRSERGIKLKKLRILQVNKFYPPIIGGVEKVVQHVAEAIIDTYNVKVLVCQKKGSTTDETVNGVSVHRSSSWGVFFSMPISFSFIRDFRRLSQDSDIVHIHMPFPLADLACFLSGYKGKVVLWWHSDIVRQKYFMPFYKPLMHWLLRRADKIVVATQGHIDGSDNLPQWSHKCIIIPYTLDKELIKDAQHYLSTSHYTRYPGCNFLFLGRLVPYKGVDILLRAFALLPTRDKHLTIAGDGPEREKLHALAHNLQITQLVTFATIANEEEKYRLYRNCDVFVLPSVSKNEAFGLVQLEAMAYGKPVINTALPNGTPSVSADHITGLTVNPGSVAELTEAMRQLASQPNLRDVLGTAAATQAAQYTQDFDLRINSLYHTL